MAQLQPTIRLIDCGVSAFSSTACGDRSRGRSARLLDVGPLEPFAQALRPGGPTRSTLPSSSASLGLGPAELDCEAW